MPSRSILRNFKFDMIITGRLIYALNWYTVVPVIPIFTVIYSLSLFDVGIFISAFLIGAGIFQIPGSVLAIRFGAKKIASLGLLIMGISAFVTGFRADFVILVIDRFFSGMGAALFFSPGITLIDNAVIKERRGTAVGIYNGAFNAGSWIALFGWVFVVAYFRWHVALWLSGLIPIVFTFFFFRYLDEVKISADSDVYRKIWSVIKHRNTLLFALSLTGLWGADYVITNVLYTYMLHLHYPPYYAGIVSSMLVFLAIFAGPLGGYLSDVFKNRLLIITASSSLFAVALVLINYSNAIEMIVMASIISITNVIAFSLIYVAPADYSELPLEYSSSAVATINSIQIAGGFAVSILFGYVASISYAYGWIYLAVCSILPLPLLLFVSDP